MKGHKCDIRVYLYIPTSVPLVAYYSPVWYMKCGHQQFNLTSTDPENVVTNTKARLKERGQGWPQVNGKLREGACFGSRSA